MVLLQKEVKNVKKTISFAIIICVLFASVNVFAIDLYGGYPVYSDIEINGNFIKCVQKPITVNGSTYIPLRAFCDAIGASISWNHEEQAATVTKDSHTFIFYGEKDFSMIDGKKSDGAVMENNLLFIPVRATCQALGFEINWDNFYYVVKITAPGITIPEENMDFSYSYEDILYLSKITQIESGSQPFKTKLGVANTVVNRVKSGLFPNTIKGVIFDTKYGTQFPPAHTDRINITPSAACILAAKCALNGENIAGNSLYFISKTVAPSSWVHNNRTFFATIGNMNFYL